VVKKQRTPKNQLFETFVQNPNEIKKWIAEGTISVTL